MSEATAANALTPALSQREREKNAPRIDLVDYAKGLGILLVVLGSCVKFDMLLVLVPTVVLAGIATVLFGIVMVHGVHLLAGIKWTYRNLIIAGTALMVGLGGLFVEPETAKLLPLTVHCLVHGAVATLLFAVFAPQLWFLGVIDFAVHFCIDRTKGYVVSHLGITSEKQYFWWVIGIDQALHHVTDFAWAMIVAASA